MLSLRLIDLRSSLYPILTAQRAAGKVLPRPSARCRPRHLITPGEILVRGDRIARPAQRHHPAGATIIDLGDSTSCRLIDAHVHLFLHPGAKISRPSGVRPERTILAESPPA